MQQLIHIGHPLPCRGIDPPQRIGNPKLLPLILPQGVVRQHLKPADILQGADEFLQLPQLFILIISLRHQHMADPHRLLDLG